MHSKHRWLQRRSHRTRFPLDGDLDLQLAEDRILGHSGQTGRMYRRLGQHVVERWVGYQTHQSLGVSRALLSSATVCRLFHKERAATDPEFCEGLEILPVTAGYCVFLPTFNAQTTLSH